MYESCQVMLIDDNEADNVYHEVVLRRAGFGGELVTHESAELALVPLRSNLHSGKPTLILLDINMPGMDGFQFVDAAADVLSTFEPVILVMLTSSTAGIDVRRAKELPVIRDYLVKPLTVDRARDILGRYFGQAAGSEA